MFRFSARILLYDIAMTGTNCSQLVFEPNLENPKATLVLGRRGVHYFSSNKIAKKQSPDGDVFLNCGDSFVLDSLKRAAHYLSLSDSADSSIPDPVSVATAVEATISPIDVAGCINEQLRSEMDAQLEALAVSDEQDFFTAFAKQLEVLRFSVDQCQ